MKDELGDRIKTQYESRTRYMLPRRTYTIIRLDGKAFHSFTAKLEKPFDHEFMNYIDLTAKYLCEQIQGAVFSYSQSDEISILLTDFATEQTCAWFDGNIQKMISVAASMATAKFNDLHNYRSTKGDKRLACFDARVFTVPDRQEVINSFIWRQNDATRNSILLVAQSLYSHKEMHGKNCSELQEMIFQKGKNWNDYSAREKRGRVVLKVKHEMPSPVKPNEKVIRNKWDLIDPPIFTQDKSFLENIIPKNN